MSDGKVKIPYTAGHVAPNEVPGGTPGGRVVRQHDLDVLTALGFEALHDLFVDVVMAIARVTGCSALDVVRSFEAAVGTLVGPIGDQAKRN